MRKSNIHSIFINCATGLGNIILFLPAYRSIRKLFPDSRYIIALDPRWFGDSFFIQLFGQDVKFIKTAIHLSRFQNLIKLMKILKYLRKEKFDIVIMPYSGNSWKLGLFLLLIGAYQTLFFKTGKRWLDKKFDICLPVIEGEHYLNRNLRLAESLGSKAEIPIGSWITLQNEEVNPQKLERNDKINIGIHPCVNEEFNISRRWPKEYFKKLINMMNKYRDDMQIILFGTLNDEKLIDEICSNEKNCIKIINKSLLEVSRYLLQCDLFIGNDSGIMNLATGLGIPTLGILGPTNPKHTGPYGDKYRTARLELSCSPCFDKGHSLKCKNRKCLIDLKPNMVWTITKEMLNMGKK